MTIRVNSWYRVKDTNQYCRVQRIPSKTNPQVHVQTASENTRGFELALEWYSALDANLEKWAGALDIASAIVKTVPEWSSGWIYRASSLTELNRQRLHTGS